MFSINPNSSSPAPSSRLSIVALLPAAGASRRLGQSKQLVEISGEPVITRAVRRAWHAGARHVVVVTGADPDGVARALPYESGATLVHNPNWERGLGSTLAVGARWILDNLPETRACLVQLPDQVFVPAHHLAELIRAFQERGASADSVVATGFPEGAGAPALFGSSWLESLAALPPEAGAKSVLNAARRLALVVHPGAAFDLDTPDDLAALSRRFVEPWSQREQPTW